ncbi:ankyrin repeat and MYND domain-containing protein 2-like [Argonauta hians]
MAANNLGELSDVEKEVIDKIPSASVEEISELLDQGVRINCYDDHGTTPLQHAAFKGRTELCKLFLDRGADVNSNHHIDGYTTLMFGAISGKPELVRTLLRAGAKTRPLNRVKRTASQMAAFVGYHRCVSAINNYVDRADIEYYSIKGGLETEPKLPKELVDPFVNLLNNSYLHPVKISYFLEKHAGLLENSQKVRNVFDIICEKSIKSIDVNEVMAIKVNYYSFLIQLIAKSYIEKDRSLNSWLKSLAKGRDSDGFAEKPEVLIRQSMKTFVYVECDLFLQFVRTISPLAIGESPTALSVLTVCVHGQQFQNNDPSCETCGEPETPKRCSACKYVYYCDQRCQKLRYPTHKKFCAKLKAEREAKEADEQKKELSKEADNQESPTGDNQELSEGENQELSKEDNEELSKEDDKASSKEADVRGA